MSSEYRNPNIDPRYYQDRAGPLNQRGEACLGMPPSPAPPNVGEGRAIVGAAIDTGGAAKERGVGSAAAGSVDQMVRAQSGEGARPPNPWPKRRDRPKYIERMTDLLGQPRYAFRRQSGARVYLPGQPHSAEFEAAYNAAVWTDKTMRRHNRKKERRHRTCAHLIDLYFGSAAYANLAPISQRAYARVLERLAADRHFGPRKVRDLSSASIRRLIGLRASTPAAADDALKKIRLLMRLAIEVGWRTDDPSEAIAKVAAGSVRAWTDTEIRQFKVRWPVSTRERTAFDLMLHQGMRACEVVAIRRSVAPEDKGSFGAGVPSSVLGEFDDRVLLTWSGRPFAAAGLGRFMSRAIAEADLPSRCTPRGLTARYKMNEMPEVHIPKSVCQQTRAGRVKTYVWGGPRPEVGRGRVLSHGHNRPCDRAPQQRVSVHPGDAPSARSRGQERQSTFIALNFVSPSRIVEHGKATTSHQSLTG